MMREELNELEASKATGGKVYVNGNTHKLAFDTIPGAFVFKNCTQYDILALCDAEIGKHATNAEYDQACYNLMKAKGWI